MLLAAMTALFLAIGILAALAAARIGRQGSRLFAASIAELAQDREMIRPENEPEGR